MDSIIEILKSDNWRELLEARFPDCDTSYWETRRQSILKAAAKPKSKKQSRRRRTSRHKRTLATVIPTIPYFQQEAKQHRGLSELTGRVNETDDESCILINVVCPVNPLTLVLER